MDAAHGKTESTRPAPSIQRLHTAGTESEIARIGAARETGRRSKVIAARTTARQGSRRLAAVARSRRCEAIARRNAAEDAEQWFKDMSGAACGARLRASAAGGCGPHGSRSRTTATTANHSQTPRQTGVVNWRQPRLEIGIVVRQAGKVQNRKHRRSAVRAEAPPCGGSQNLQIPVLNGARPAGFGTRTFAPPVDRVGQKAGACISAEPKPQAGSGPRNSTNCKTAENRRKPRPINKQSLNHPRHYAASGLLNLQTTLTRAVAPVTPGVKLPGAKIKQKIIHAEKFTGETDEGSESECKEKHSMA